MTTSTNHDDADDQEPGGFTHLRTSASQAPRPATTAPNSVFALGGLSLPEPEVNDPPPASPPARQPHPQAVERARKVQVMLAQIDLLGSISRPQLCKVLNSPKPTVTKLIANNVGKTIELDRIEGRVGFYVRLGQVTSPPEARKCRLAPTAKPKNQIQIPKATAHKLPPAAGLPAQAPARGAVAAVAPDTIEPAPTWSAGFFNTGHLVIEANGQGIKLIREQSRGLVQWLLKVDQAVQA